LPEVLNKVRMIWELSSFYHSEERMKGLLVKISNQIIERCKDKIKVNGKIDFSQVEKCMEDLAESIECCKQWANICKD
jgi:hypothetical protein